MTPQGRAADIGTAVAIAIPVSSWISTANEVVQLLAGLVAIIAGAFSIRYYWRKRNS